MIDMAKFTKGTQKPKNKLTGERAYTDAQWAKVQKRQPKWTGEQLLKYQRACEIYAEKLNAFKAGKMVKASGKGKDRKVTVTIVPNHPAQPSFNKIYKAVLAGKAV